jgi:hypothetical protein
VNQQEREAIGKAVYDADPYSHNPLATPWEHLGASQELDIKRGEAAVQKFLELRGEDFYFVSPEHRQRFLAAMQQTGKVHKGRIDEEYGAALYVLTSSSGTWERSQPYIGRDGIDFDALLGEQWSGAYVSLLQLAGNLFNAGYTKCSPVDFVTGLDERNYNVAMTAFKIRRRSWPIAAFKIQEDE